jgi:hypothetical protein
MRRLALLALIAASLLASITAAPVAAAPSHSAKSCSRGYVRAVVGGSVKCLHSGQFCSASSQGTYRRYGFVCAPGSDGRNRLSHR